MPDHPRLGILVGLVLDQVVAATGLVMRAAPMQHQAFATRVLDRGQACIQRGTVAHLELFHRMQPGHAGARSEEHTSELQSLMRISTAVFCLKKKKKNSIIT